MKEGILMFDPNRVAEVLSILLSEQYGVEIKVIPQEKEVEKK